MRKRVLIACMVILSLVVAVSFVSAQETLPWGVDRIDADMVWDQVTGSGVKVAILDTGVDVHPDLPQLQGVNTVDDKLATDYSDDHGHGTMIAGIIAAVHNNGIGVMGVAPGVQLYAVRFRKKSGTVPPDQTPDFNYRKPETYRFSDLYEGMQACINAGVDIISMSFGIWTVDRRGHRKYPLHDPEFHRLIHEAYTAGIVIVAASGNDGRELQIYDYYNSAPKVHTAYSDKRYDFPASYPEVIGIAATGRKLTKGKPSERQMVDYFPRFSNWGPAIDLAAPGSRIESTRNDESDEEYGTGGGTSYASPHVSATAALVLAEYPGLPPRKVRDHLMTTAESLSTIDPAGDYGAGLVDAEAAVNTMPGSAPSSAPARYTVSPIRKLSVTWGELKAK